MTAHPNKRVSTPIARDSIVWKCHLRAALPGPSGAIPFVDGTLALGTWPQFALFELDTRPRGREIVVQIVGEELTRVLLGATQRGPAVLIVSMSPVARGRE
jgi:hypothetical protein